MFERLIKRDFYTLTRVFGIKERERERSFELYSLSIVRIIMEFPRSGPLGGEGGGEKKATIPSHHGRRVSSSNPINESIL